MAELNGSGISAVLAANAQLDVRVGGFAAVDALLNQGSDARLIDRGEWILRQNVEILVLAEKTSSIVTAHAQSGLGQVVRSEAEELSGLSNLSRGYSCTWHFDHGTDEVVDLQRPWLSEPPWQRGEQWRPDCRARPGSLPKES